MAKDKKDSIRSNTILQQQSKQSIVMLLSLESDTQPEFSDWIFN